MKTRLSLPGILFLVLLVSSSLLVQAFADSYTLTLSQTGVGTITTTPTGTPSGPGSQSYPAGTKVTVSIATSPGWMIKAVNYPSIEFDDLTSQIRSLDIENNSSPVESSANQLTGNLTMNQAKSIAVTFSPIIEVVRVGAGTVVSSPAGLHLGVWGIGRFNHGEIVTLSAVPADGATFLGWSRGASGTDDLVLDSQQPHYVTATFTSQGKFNLTVEATGLGRIASDPAGIDSVSSRSAFFQSIRTLR